MKVTDRIDNYLSELDSKQSKIIELKQRIEKAKKVSLETYPERNPENDANVIALRKELNSLKESVQSPGFNKKQFDKNKLMNTPLFKLHDSLSDNAQEALADMYHKTDKNSNDYINDHTDIQNDLKSKGLIELVGKTWKITDKGKKAIDAFDAVYNPELTKESLDEATFRDETMAAYKEFEKNFATIKNQLLNKAKMNVKDPRIKKLDDHMEDVYKTLEDLISTRVGN